MTATLAPVDDHIDVRTTPAPAAPTQVHATTRPGRERTLALVSLLLASMMELIDITIVNVALPSIERALGASAATLQWVVAAYPLAFGIALISGARLGDRFGRRRLFLAGLVGFTAASVLCGIAPTVGALVAFRVLQGLAAAAMVPQVLTSIQVMYAPHERGTAMGVFSGLAGLASVLGPILGAVLTDGIGWRAVFLVNVPVGLVAIAAALRFVPESRSERASRLDFRGVAVLSVGLLAVLYPLTMGHELGWPVWTYAVMLAGAAVLAGFVVTERRHERAGDEPLVATSLYASRAFTGGSLVGGLMFVANAGYFLGATLYYQIGLGWSVLQAGLVNIPFALTATVAAGSGAAVLMPRIGRQVLLLGSVIMIAGFGVLALTVAGAGTSTSYWAFVPAQLVIGTGFGFLVSSIAPLALSGVELRHAGAASGQFNTTGQVANAVGAAALGTLLFEVSGRHTAGGAVDAFRPGFLAVLAVAAALIALVGLATRIIPADAHLCGEPRREVK